VTAVGDVECLMFGIGNPRIPDWDTPCADAEVVVKKLKTPCLRLVNKAQNTIFRP
jgi:hypothetical protein